MALWETGCPETKHFLEESATSKKFLRRADLFNGLEDAHLHHTDVSTYVAIFWKSDVE